jgi:hypothetical protein
MGRSGEKILSAGWHDDVMAHSIPAEQSNFIPFKEIFQDHPLRGVDPLLACLARRGIGGVTYL